VSKFIDANKFPAQNRLMPIRKKKLSPERMRKFIHSLRGKFKFNTGGKSFREWMVDLKREEKELEERKIQRGCAAN
jgi:hypothetical protein